MTQIRKMAPNVIVIRVRVAVSGPQVSGRERPEPPDRFVDFFVRGAAVRVGRE